MANLSSFNLILSICYLIAALFVFLNNKRDNRNIFLGLLAFNFGFWSFNFSRFIIASDDSLIYLWGKLTFVTAFLIGAWFYMFALVFPRNHSILKNKVKLIISLLPAIVIACLILFSNLIVTKFNYKTDLLGEKAGIGSLFFIGGIIEIIYFITGIILFYQRLKSSTGRERMQILWLYLSLAIWTSCFAIFTLILPSLGNKSLVWIAPSSAFIFIGGIAYSLFKYRLLDIEIAIKRTTLYLLLIGIITGLYTFILMLPQGFVGEPGSVGSIFLMILAAIIIATTLQPLRDWLDNITDRIFFHKQYDYYKVLEKTSRELSSVVKLQDVLDVVTRPLINEMHLKGIGIYLREKSGKISFGCLKKEGLLAQVLPDSVNDENPLISFLIENKAMIESGEFRHKYGHLYTDNKILDPEKAKIQEALDITFQAGLVLPIVLKQNLIGLMILGEKKSGDQFTTRDLALLETIASQMAITIENTKLYEQMLNNERLTVLGSMSASIAHEIRNPLAAIKTFVQMLPYKYEKPEFRRRFDEVIPSEIERLSRITEDLLNFARPSPPAMTPTDVNVLLERVTTLLANQMRKKAIVIEPDMGEVPLIMADSQQLTQVFMNLVINAVQASHDASRIFITTRLKTLPPNAGSEQKVYISIRDEGVGIKTGDRASIFEPYFTTKHEGTGLGLATTKRIVDAHKGDIEVDSQEGKGATFTVVLPFNPAPTLANRK